MTQKTAVIFGGTGFIGKILVRALAKADYSIIVPTRNVASAYDLKPCGSVGQIVAVNCDYSEDSIKSCIPEDADLVVNLIGILFEQKTGDFGRAHIELPWRIAKACKASHVKSFVHLSALGIEENESKYAYTKREGEKAIHEDFPEAVFLRPSVVFGPEDGFFNKFAQLSVVLPFLPLIGGGKTKFQPVYVKDVVDAVIAAAADKSLKGQIVDCVGPETVDFKEIYQKLAYHTGRKRALLPLPWSIAKIQAFFLGLLPNPLLTQDQVTSLKSDNISHGAHKTLIDLGIRPTPMDTILPEYLCKYQVGGMFGKPRQQE